MTIFPVHVAATGKANGIFDDKGYWASLGGIHFQMPAGEPGNKTTVQNVAKMLNAAYAQGRSDQRKDIRECLGIGEDMEP